VGAIGPHTGDGPPAVEPRALLGALFDDESAVDPGLAHLRPALRHPAAVLALVNGDPLPHAALAPLGELARTLPLRRDLARPLRLATLGDLPRLPGLTLRCDLAGTLALRGRAGLAGISPLR
jgi:hypothetical protein